MQLYPFLIINFNSLTCNYIDRCIQLCFLTCLNNVLLYFVAFKVVKVVRINQKIFTLCDVTAGIQL